MQLKFKHQAFQTAAVDAVADLFTGQEKQYHQFTISGDARMNNSMKFSKANPMNFSIIFSIRN
jgi:restriction endonuclease